MRLILLCLLWLQDQPQIEFPEGVDRLSRWSSLSRN